MMRTITMIKTTFITILLSLCLRSCHSIDKCLCGRGGTRGNGCQCYPLPDQDRTKLYWDRQRENFCGGPDEWNLHAHTNSAREQFSLDPVSCNQVLTDMAEEYSQLLCETGCFGHSCDGLGFSYRLKTAGYDMYRSSIRAVTTGAENLFWGTHSTPDRVVERWLGSPAHRQNLLNPNFSEMGVGVVRCRDGRTYWTQVFGWPEDEPSWGLQYHV